MALVGVLLAAATYHLVLQLLRPDAHEYGWFALFLAEAGIYSFLRMQLKYEVFPDFVAMKKVEHLMLYAMPATAVQFVWLLFGQVVSRVMRALQGLLMVVGVAVVVAPGLGLAVSLLPLLHVLLLVTGVAAVPLVARRARDRDIEAVTVGVAILLTVAAGLNDALVERGIYVAPRLATAGFGLLVAGMGASLASRFHRALGALDKLTQELETRVALRTQQLSDAYRSMEERAMRDGLTGLLNRRALRERAQAGMTLSRRRRSAFALALLDVDAFKAVNDTHGHAVGDQLLVQLARRLSEGTRGSDDIGRWGGEEFLVVLPESSASMAHSAAERWRVLVESTPFEVADGTVLPVTLSIGVAAVGEPDVTPAAFDALLRAGG